MNNMRKLTSLFLVLTAFVLMTQELAAQPEYSPADPEYYAMDREHINFEDYHVFLFNYRGFVSPRQFSITQFTHVQFLPIAAEMYNFNLNFYDKGTGRLIKDDVPVMLEVEARRISRDEKL